MTAPGSGASVAPCTDKEPCYAEADTPLCERHDREFREWRAAKRARLAEAASAPSGAS